jgi:pimeloyl-ACP methyl ester carboxylesterase
MSTYVLVHGSFHGSWCWDGIVSRLGQAGHRAVAVDLPGRAGDGRRAATLTLEDYAGRVVDAVAAEKEPVVLVGHSMGGVVITQAAEQVPERIARLAYVCAFLPAHGQSLYDLARTDGESLLLRNLVFEEHHGTHHVRPEGARESLYHDCSDEDAARATARLCPESMAVVAAPVRTSAERFGRVPRHYIECSDDRALGPTLQKRMHTATPCRVTRIVSSHSPFLSRPDELARALT